MNKQILSLAIPNIISNITVPLLGLTDTYIAGHFDKHEYIGAIGLANILFNLIYMPFSFLRMSTSGFTAQAFGANNYHKITNTLLRALLIGLIVSITILLFQQVISTIGFHYIKGDPLVKDYAKIYFNIYIWSAPAVLSLYAINGWFVGMQNSTTPMFVAISINVVNIGLSLFLVKVLHWQIEGVAVGSTVAQYVGLFLSIIIWNKQYSSKIKAFIDLRVLKRLSEYTAFLKVNTDIFIRTLALITVTTFFTSMSSKIGKETLSANLVLLQFFSLFSYIMDGFAYAAEALTGKYVGAKKPERLKQLVKLLFLWGAIFVTLFTSAYSLWLENILHFLTDKTEIIQLALQYKYWILLVPLVGFAAFIWDGIFIGANYSKGMRNSMLFATAIFFIIFYGFNKNYNNNLLWFAFIMYLATRSIAQTFLSKKVLSLK